MPQDFENKPQARLALSRARSGLVRARNGWASENIEIDQSDLVNFRTVTALAARGLIVIDACGSRARLSGAVDRARAIRRDDRDVRP